MWIPGSIIGYVCLISEVIRGHFRSNLLSCLNNNAEGHIFSKLSDPSFACILIYTHITVRGIIGYVSLTSNHSQIEVKL